MEKIDFLKMLLGLAEQCGIPLSEAQALLCREHISLMLEWNRNHNLTRITDPKEIIEKHLLDSLIPARWLRQAGPALDIGTGPGFPGIPLKILHPELEMLLLDSQRKKVSFLKIVLSKLPLQNISALQGRWEELAQGGHPLVKSPFKLAMMRAVRLEPEHISVAAANLLGPDGLFAWWGGPSADLKWCDHHRERFENAGMTFAGRHSYALPSAVQLRHLYLWRKTGSIE
jgi:16S rRNA (guanine527-N7)-methyltransferase